MYEGLFSLHMFLMVQFQTKWGLYLNFYGFFSCGGRGGGKRMEWMDEIFYAMNNVLLIPC